MVGSVGLAGIAGSTGDRNKIRVNPGVDVGHCGHTAGRAAVPRSAGGRADVRDRGGGHVTYPPNVRTAPPAGAGRHAPAQPPAAGRPRRAAAPGPRAWSGCGPRRRPSPGGCGSSGPCWPLLVVAFGAVTAWQITDRATAADDVVQPQPAAERGRRGHLPLAGRRRHRGLQRLPGRRQEPRDVRERYEKDIARRRPGCWSRPRPTRDGFDRVRAARSPSSTSCCPEYTGLVERPAPTTGRACRSAAPICGTRTSRCSSELLPAAERAVRRRRPAGSATDYDDARAGRGSRSRLGVVALGAPGLGAAAQLPAYEPGVQPRAARRDGRRRRWCCCGWSSGTRVARVRAERLRRRTAQQSLQGAQRRPDRLPARPAATRT